MKYSGLIVFSFLLLASCSTKKEIKWQQYERGKKASLKENKLMMVYFTADSCKNCEEINSKFFENEEIRNDVNESFIPIKVDIATVDSVDYDTSKVSIKEFKLSLKVPGVPAIVFLKPGEEWIETYYGLDNIEEAKIVFDFYKLEVYKDTKLVDYRWFRFFSKLAEEDPKNAELQFLIGYFYFHAVKQFDVAEGFFKKVIDLDPEYAEAYALIYIIKTKKDNYDQKEAEKWINKAKKLGFNDYAEIQNKIYSLANKYGPPVWN